MNDKNTEHISEQEKRGKSFRFLFPKKKDKKKVKQQTAEVKRFNAAANEGLSAAQVDERISQGLVNKSGKKYSKSYKSIFLGNTLVYKSINLVLEYCKLLGHGCIERNHCRRAVGLGTNGTELKTVAGKGKRRCAVTVGIVYH